MPRRRKKAEQPSSLPEKFEDFAAQHPELNAAEPEPAAVAEKPKTQTIGGMVETKWSGKRMFRCPRCGGTTFSEPESRVHQCKVPRFADEEFAD